MPKKKIIDITNDLKNDRGEQHFYPNYTTILMPESHKDNKIESGKDISINLDIDSEFSTILKPLSTLTKNDLLDIRPKLIQYFDLAERYFDKNGVNLKELIKAPKRTIYQINENEELNRIKLQRPTLLTIQVNDPILNNKNIFINPAFKSFYESHVEDKNLHYPSFKSDNFLQDYLINNGYSDAEIIRFDSNEELKNYEINTNAYKNVKKCNNGNIEHKLPYMCVNSKMFFGLAEITKIFKGEFLKDIIKFILDKKLVFDKKLTSYGNSDYQKELCTNWILKINDKLQYIIKLKITDICALHGMVSLKTLKENLGFKVVIKNSLDDYKENMGLAMIEYPQLFKDYASNDSELYCLLERNNIYSKDIDNDLGILEYNKEPKLTLGSTCDQKLEAVILKYLNIPFSKNNKQELSFYTEKASPKYLSSYKDLQKHQASNNILRKHTLSKTFGGRCYNNDLTSTSLKGILCDIDMSGAYATISSNLSYFIGSPVIINCEYYKVTLRSFLNNNRKNFVPRGYKIVVETKKGHPLKYDQDFLPSWINPRRDDFYTKNKEGETIINTTFNLEENNTDIFTREVYNGTITHDILELIELELKPRQREDLLDNLYVVSSIFYPKNFECSNVEELKDKINLYKETGKEKFVFNFPFCHIDNDIIENPCNYWHQVNFGDLLMDELRKNREFNKDINLGLSNKYKLTCNTIYGVNVSPLFDNSNIILAANITSIGRTIMWYAEKACSLKQSITDGGIFDLNNVIHPINKNIDTTVLSGAYRLTKEYLNKNDKWKYRPITENQKPIEYNPITKDFFIDNNLYDYNKAKYKIVDLFSNHMRKIFPNNELLNGNFHKHLNVSNNENSLITKKGMVSFEVKEILKKASFHGSADYAYISYDVDISTGKDKTKYKKRGVDTSKQKVISWFLDENNYAIYDENYYQNISPLQVYFDQITNNPDKIDLKKIRPYTKSSLLKTAEFVKHYEKTYRFSNLVPGDEYYKVIQIPLLTIRFHFISLEQKKCWLKRNAYLKNKFEGLSFEIFYTDDNGICNYKKMINELDSYVAKGIIDPFEIFDPHNNLKRNLSKKYPYALKHAELVRQAKEYIRLLIVGYEPFVKEKFKLTDNVIPFPKKDHSKNNNLNDELYEEVTDESYDFDNYDNDDNYIDYLDIK